MLKQSLWKLLLFLLIREAVHAFPQTMGLEFAVALPRLMDEGIDTTPVLFILTTFQIDEFKVKFQFVDLSEEISVSKTVSGKYLLPDKYELDVQVGPKPSYHFVSFVFPFGLTVHLFNMNVSASSFMALPITAWGRQYYTANLRGKPSYQIISSNYQNNINIKIVLILSNFTISYNGTSYKNRDEFKIVLEKFEAFAISACADDTYEEGDVSNTRIKAKWPIGVVTGNCLAVTDTYTCFKKDKVEKGSSRDGTAEMLIPFEYFGTEFILMTLTHRRVPGKVIITCPSETYFAAINLSIGFSGIVQTFYVGLIDIIHMDIKENAKLTSSLPIQLMYVQRSECFYAYLGTHEVYGDVAFSIVLPTSLYYVAYIWSNPEYATLNYVALIVPFLKIKIIYLNTVPLLFRTWEMVAGAPIYRIGHLPIPHGHYFINTSPAFKFGCYLYGYGLGMAYMHLGGFQDCKLSKENHLMNDNIDNDCDGRTDEEEKNHKDDDGDELIDEDLSIEQNADGEWGAWKSWTCYENCSFPLLYHRRMCDSPPPQGFGEPCLGPDEEFTQVVCLPTIKCPEKVCPKKKWGPSCSWDCSHCSSNCEKLNGSCNYCKSGWKNPKHACDQECGLDEWGENCLYSCYEKCWADCIDRETGECSPVTILITVLPWILCFGFISATALMCHKKREREEMLKGKVEIEVREKKPEPSESKERKREIVRMHSNENKRVKKVRKKVWKWLMTSKADPSIPARRELPTSDVSEED